MNFRNRIALRIALLVAVSATILSFLPYLNWLAAGYFAVFFYRRRTGHLLSPGAGLRMGWITGVMMFAIVAAIFAAFVAVINTPSGMEMLQTQFKNAPDPRVTELIQTLQTGSGIAIFLMQLFFFITCLSMAGGALGAKLLGWTSRPPGGGHIV
jgi:hypothetical protein